MDRRTPVTFADRTPVAGAPVRLGAAAFVAAGAMFLLYPAVRPAGDAAEVVASTAWVSSHLFAMIGFILVPFGLFTLLDTVRDGRARQTSRYALATGWLGAGLVLPYYGAEDFGLHVIAARAVRENDLALMELANAFRFHPVAATTFVLGLLLLAVSGVLTAIAISRSGTPARWSGIPLAAGFVLFFPQFYTPAPVRTAHGVLMAVGCVWVGVTLWRSRRA